MGVSASDLKPDSSRLAFALPPLSVQIVAMIGSTGDVVAQRRHPGRASRAGQI
jgi:hypothetical protein